MADLLTVAEYKAFDGIPVTDTRKDAKIAALLPAVTLAIQAYTDRDFTVSSGLAGARQYMYDNCGILDIDDCTTVTSVSTDAGIPGTSYDLDPLAWVAMPATSPINNYLLILGGPFGNRWNGEMGFTRNLDNYEWAGRDPIMTVTATWGWPAVPQDVKLAAYWTTNEIMNRPSGEALQSEAIEGYSRSWGRGQTVEASLAIPGRARDLLSSYQRLTVP